MTTFRNVPHAALLAGATWMTQWDEDWMTSMGARDDGGLFLVAMKGGPGRATPVTLRWVMLDRDGNAQSTAYGEESALYEYEVMSARTYRSFPPSDDHQKSIDEWMVLWGAQSPLISIEEVRP